MNDLTPILLVLLAGTVTTVVYFWRKVSRLEQFLRAEQKALEEKREDIDRAKKDARERRDELEQVRKQLADTKGKLAKKKEAVGPPEKSSKRERAASPEAEAAPTVSAIVRVTDKEVEEMHRTAVERLEAELDAARNELDRLKQLEARRVADAKRAAEALAAAEAAASNAQAAPPPPPPPSTPAASPSEEIEALKTQIEALKRAAFERQRELEKRLHKAEDANNHALRRAANNLQLYQVIKGQLELTEDRIAALKRKYEGAKSFDELRREQQKKDKRERRQRGERNGDGPSAEAAPAGGPLGEASQPEAPAAAAPSEAPAAQDAPASETTTPPESEPAPSST